MKNRSEWLILAFIALFLAIPLSTIPGMFEVVSVLILVITLLLAVLIVLSIVQRGPGIR
jgi:hypothetical protein